MTDTHVEPKVPEVATPTPWSPYDILVQYMMRRSIDEVVSDLHGMQERLGCMLDVDHALYGTEDTVAGLAERVKVLTGLRKGKEPVFQHNIPVWAQEAVRTRFTELAKRMVESAVRSEFAIRGR
jgi:hypothetical protein